MQRFDIVPQPSGMGSTGPWPDPITNMFVLRRATRSNLDVRLGDIVPITQAKIPVHLMPCLRQKADPRLSRYNIIEWNREFFLNKFFNKDIFNYLNSV